MELNNDAGRAGLVLKGFTLRSYHNTNSARTAQDDQRRKESTGQMRVKGASTNAVLPTLFCPTITLKPGVR